MFGPISLAYLVLMSQLVVLVRPRAAVPTAMHMDRCLNLGKFEILIFDFSQNHIT